jgi:hypothetical protein
MSEVPKKRTRLTAEQKKERENFAEREAKTRANKLRSKDKEFHGLEREFMNHQVKMLSDYEISKDIKHPRDVGTVREVLLRNFLVENKLLPKRYSVSDNSVRVASTTGHLSSELDILLYDALDSFTLMQRQGVYEVLPVEYCYGAIQVKSRLNKEELTNALENIKSFKRLQRLDARQLPRSDAQNKIQDNGFGIIFAYDSDMDWADLVSRLKSYAQTCDRSFLPNAVVILSKGHFAFGDRKSSSAYNSDIIAFDEVVVHGYPDRQGTCLYTLYSIIFELLSATRAQKALPHNYFRLPLTAGDYSYSYQFAGFAEFAHCDEHGDYARAYTPEKLARIISWCETAEPINWVRATDLAYGKPGDNFEAYDRQPQYVRIYNPKYLELSQILVADKKISHDGNEITTTVISFDIINSCGMTIYIPYYYQITENLVKGCPKCEKARKP